MNPAIPTWILLALDVVRRRWLDQGGVLGSVGCACPCPSRCYCSQSPKRFRYPAGPSADLGRAADLGDGGFSDNHPWPRRRRRDLSRFSCRPFVSHFFARSDSRAPSALPPFLVALSGLHCSPRHAWPPGYDSRAASWRESLEPAPQHLVRRLARVHSGASFRHWCRHFCGFGAPCAD